MVATVGFGAFAVAALNAVFAVFCQIVPVWLVYRWRWPVEPHVSGAFATAKVVVALPRSVLARPRVVGLHRAGLWGGPGVSRGRARPPWWLELHRVLRTAERRVPDAERALSRLHCTPVQGFRKRASARRRSRAACRLGRHSLHDA